MALVAVSGIQLTAIAAIYAGLVAAVEASIWGWDIEVSVIGKLLLNQSVVFAAVTTGQNFFGNSIAYIFDIFGQADFGTFIAIVAGNISPC